jgi:hypothetical protein
MFEKVVLEANGQLPPVFLDGTLPCDSVDERLSVLDEG